jgi:hypothetical protein
MPKFYVLHESNSSCRNSGEFLRMFFISERGSFYDMIVAIIVPIKAAKKGQIAERIKVQLSAEL